MPCRGGESSEPRPCPGAKEETVRAGVCRAHLLGAPFSPWQLWVRMRGGKRRRQLSDSEAPPARVDPTLRLTIPGGGRWRGCHREGLSAGAGPEAQPRDQCRAARRLLQKTLFKCVSLPMLAVPAAFPPTSSPNSWVRGSPPSPPDSFVWHPLLPVTAPRFWLGGPWRGRRRPRCGAVSPGPDATPGGLGLPCLGPHRSKGCSGKMVTLLDCPAWAQC